MAVGNLSLNRNCVAARIALGVYLSGFLCFLIGISTPNWLNVDHGMQSGLWSVCYYVQTVGWTCNGYSGEPGLQQTHNSAQHKAGLRVFIDLLTKTYPALHILSVTVKS